MRAWCALLVLGGCYIKPDETGTGNSACPGTFDRCFTFEDGTLAGWTESTAGSGGVATVDSIHARVGAKAAHLHVDGGNSGYPDVRLRTSIGGGATFIRTFLWIGDVYGGADLVDFQVSSGGLIVVGTSGTVVAYPENLTPDPFTTATSNVAVKHDQWECLEVELDQANRELYVWLDDAELVHVTSIGPTDPFDSLVLVGNSYISDPPSAVDKWFDEVAINGSRIGCTVD